MFGVQPSPSVFNLVQVYKFLVSYYSEYYIIDTKLFSYRVKAYVKSYSKWGRNEAFCACIK